MRRVRRLRLARLMRIEKGENRPSVHGKAFGKSVRLRDHTAHLRVFQRRSAITVSDGRETVDFIDNYQTCPPAVGCKSELFIRDRRRLADVSYKLVHCALLICEPREYCYSANIICRQPLDQHRDVSCERSVFPSILGGHRLDRRHHDLLGCQLSLDQNRCLRIPDLDVSRHLRDLRRHCHAWYRPPHPRAQPVRRER